MASQISRLYDNGKKTTKWQEYITNKRKNTQYREILTSYISEYKQIKTCWKSAYVQQGEVFLAEK